MGGLTSRNKGKRGEREVADLLQPTVDCVATELGLDAGKLLIQRNTVQSDRGGSDLTGLPGLSIEVKLCETLALESWWTQCQEQARGSKRIGAGGVPVLFYRSNRKAWRVRMEGYVGTAHGPGGAESFRRAPWPMPTRAVVDISLADFLAWFDRWCRQWLKADSHLYLLPTCGKGCKH